MVRRIAKASNEVTDDVNAGPTPIENKKESGWQVANRRASAAIRDDHIAPDARDYLSGLLRMTKERNFTNIAHTAGNSPQNVQHFTTNSPWDATDVLAQIREEIREIPQLTV
jgi:SRSO17 transposase